MKTAGIAIDRWKLPIFTRHLEAAGYSITEEPAFSPETMMLKVPYEDLAPLQKVIEAAQAECGGGTLQ